MIERLRGRGVGPITALDFDSVALQMQSLN